MKEELLGSRGREMVRGGVRNLKRDKECGGRITRGCTKR